MGEYTVVASANRGVRGGLSEDSFEDIDEPESVLDLRSITSGAGRFFSSSILLGLASIPKITWHGLSLTKTHIDVMKERMICVEGLSQVYSQSRRRRQ
jgi:hypothetical protein